MCFCACIIANTNKIDIDSKFRSPKSLLVQLFDLKTLNNNEIFMVMYLDLCLKRAK